MKWVLYNVLFALSYCVVLPSFLIILLVAAFYERFRKNRIVDSR